MDDHPLYAMRYYGSYDDKIISIERDELLSGSASQFLRTSTSSLEWSCSLFVALGNADDMLYGRNFDWEYSPAVILFTNPPDGYASVSMMDIKRLGFDGSRVGIVTDLPIEQRKPLLFASFFPFDGMNEHGLVVGMAAVPHGQMTHNPNKEFIESYNIDMRGGPPLHHLIAAPTGRSALVEFYKGEMVVIRNENPWHLATNYLLASVDESAEGECWRYDEIRHRLRENEGQIGLHEIVELLEDVSQDTTQWSIVYGVSTLDINVTLGRQYENVHSYDFDYLHE